MIQRSDKGRQARRYFIDKYFLYNQKRTFEYGFAENIDYEAIKIFVKASNGKNRIKDYGFIENQDYTSVKTFTVVIIKKKCIFVVPDCL